MTAGSTRILVVDDERPIRRALEVTLAKAGYAVSTAIDASEALTQAALQPPDLVILDLMLPDADGADVCRQLRDWMQAPILLISAVGEEQDKIRALDAGADDYLTKPFGIGELLARVRALLRRSEGTVSGEQVIEVGELTIDLPHRIVTAAGNEVHLTPTEFDLLKELALADGRPLTHKMLLRKVWGAGYAQEMQLLRTHMGRLRDKLEANGRAAHLDRDADRGRLPSARVVTARVRGGGNGRPCGALRRDRGGGRPHRHAGDRDPGHGHPRPVPGSGRKHGRNHQVRSALMKS